LLPDVLLPDKCPACGAGVRGVIKEPDVGMHISIFTCCNTYSHVYKHWLGVCDNSYDVAVKMRQALTFYATAMASDISYDGGAKARVALLPVV